MRLLTLLILLSLIGGSSAFFGIFRFFDSGSRAARNVGKLSTAIRDQIVPDLSETLQMVRKSTTELVSTAKQLERRIEQTLEKFDQVIGNVNNVVDIVVVVACILVFYICSKVNANSRDDHIKYEFMLLLKITSLMTAVGVAVGVFCFSVLNIKLSPASRIVYCAVMPTVVAILIKILRLLFFTVCGLGPVVYYIILPPRLIIYISLDGPIRWVWRAYNNPEKSRSAYVMSVSLPWLSLVICLLMFNFIMNLTDNDRQAFWMSLLAAYLFFWTNAVYLYAYHQRPSPQDRLRTLYGTEPTTSQGKCTMPALPANGIRHRRQ